ncbi:3'5'-cyclic nucleotide phosphodiesterase family protein [Trichomonas vaginalis G3]|uniref:3'5'-cyclic nucleotide phosphodiesterase family protein n=1 Tax=Trichomonas vaginalis (strain ATCC PRA-98 / G3) TaxID=412133 RepID=A2EA57_TRIV3|nr:3',5'-cyclic-nucleotide phosphodiesterase protein [Trichomonas vaginalis G3]EAY10503.1 3'5'-cyclic nucleotide phosphodiesterase family protein [Trichomonas vaginalis G3]KAI5489269.1 3',5'-cyclic-nucleotide phosphodiesterase protein [Trichomonas vaginalis G3]|eukprot:XP_001322726.1 3'5'-cyclic nucleotide phosphodiesterase family protein [Trichomonas vaginalis G3]
MRPQTVAAKNTSRSFTSTGGTLHDGLRRPPKLKSLEDPINYIRTLTQKANAYAQALTALELDRESNLSVMDSMEREIHQNSEQILALSKLNDQPFSETNNESNPTEKTTNNNSSKNSIQVSFGLPERSTESADIINKLKQNPLFIKAFDTKANIDEIAKSFKENSNPTGFNYIMRQLSRMALINDVITPLANKVTIGVNKDDFTSLLDQSLRLLFPNASSRVVDIGSDVETKAVLTVDGNVILECKEKHMPHQETMLKSTLGFLKLPSPQPPDNSVKSLFGKPTFFDQKTEKFTEEDKLIANHFSDIAKPIIERFLRYDRLNKLCENRRFAYEFSRDILTRRTITELLPFLLISVGTYLSANDVELFLVDNENFVYYDVQGRDLIKKSLKQCGVPLYVLKSQKAVEISYLTKSCEYFSEEIDSWAENQPFIASPIISNDIVIGVLCCAGNIKSLSFSDKDIELLKDMCSVLAAVIPFLCAKELESEEKIDPKQSLLLYQKMNENETDNYLMNVANLLSISINCEFIVIFCQNKTKIILKNGEDFGRLIFTEVSMKSISENSQDKVLIANPCTKIPNFASVSDVRCENLIAFTQRNITFCCVNSQNENKEFSDFEQLLIQSLHSYAKVYDEINIRKSNISDLKQKSFQMREILENSAKSKSLSELMDIVTEKMKMNAYSIWKYTPLLQTFNCVLSNKIQKNSIIPCDDYLFNSFVNLESEYMNETIVAGNQSKYLLMINQINGCVYAINIYKHIIVFSGDSLSKDAPLIAHDYSSLIHFMMIKELKNDLIYEAIDLNNTKISDAEINHRLFCSSNYNDPELIEIVLRIFKMMKVQATLSKQDFEMAKFILKCREMININQKPFHNFRHSVDCLQFVYYTLLKSRLCNKLDPHQIVGLLFATLLHDVSHNGYNDEYHKNNKTHLYFVDNNYPMETYHCKVASKIIDEYFPNMNQSFWSMFIPCIKATSILKLVEMSSRIVMKTDEISNDFVFISSFVCSMSNTANSFRTFEFGKIMANNIFKELTELNEIEKSKNLPLSNMLPIGSFDNVESLESAFITTTAMPAMRALTTLFPDMSDIYVQLEENKKQWENLKRMIQQQQEQK